MTTNLEYNQIKSGFLNNLKIKLKMGNHQVKKLKVEALIMINQLPELDIELTILSQNIKYHIIEFNLMTSVPFDFIYNTYNSKKYGKYKCRIKKINNYWINVKLIRH